MDSEEKEAMCDGNDSSNSTNGNFNQFIQCNH